MALKVLEMSLVLLFLTCAGPNKSKTRSNVSPKIIRRIHFYHLDNQSELSTVSVCMSNLGGNGIPGENIRVLAKSLLTLFTHVS